MSVFRQDPKVWFEGFRAGKFADLPAENPYPPESVLGWAWISGYVEGKARRGEDKPQPENA